MYVLHSTKEITDPEVKFLNPSPNAAFVSGAIVYLSLINQNFHMCV